MNLTHEEQKLLTEWLGECWHEYGSRKCITCTIMEPEDDPPRLDFSDWRVVGRLVAKLPQIDNYRDNEGNHYARIGYSGRCYSAFTPQLAICKAVVAYLKEAR